MIVDILHIFNRFRLDETGVALTTKYFLVSLLRTEEDRSELFHWIVSILEYIVIFNIDT